MDYLNQLENDERVVRVLTKGKRALTYSDRLTSSTYYESFSFVKQRLAGEGFVIRYDDVVDILDGFANDFFNCFLFLRDITLAFSLGLTLI